MNDSTTKTIKKAVLSLSALLAVSTLSAQDIARPQPAQVSGARADYSQVISQPVDKADFSEEKDDSEEDAEAKPAKKKKEVAVDCEEIAGSNAEVRYIEKATNAAEVLNPDAELVDERTVYILDVDIEGATIFSKVQLRHLIEDRLRSEFNFSKIKGLATTLEAFYKQNGYKQARVIIPTGALDGTTLKIVVLETPEADSAFAEAQKRAESQKVYILDVNIEGSSVYSAAQLKHLIADRLRTDFTFEEIQGLADTIQRHYRENGYPVVRVIVPKSGLQGTVLTLKVLEGKLGEVKVSGNKRVSTKKVKNTILSYIDEGKAFEVESLESSLVMLNSMSGVSVSSYLEAGMEEGTTDLNIEVKEENRITGSIEINNFGSENSGEYRVIPYVSFKNLTGIGDELSAYAAIAMDEPDTWSYQIAYRAPINDIGTSVSAYFGQGNNTVGNEYEVFDIDGDSMSWGLGLSHKFLWGAKRSLTLEAMFDWLDYSQTILSEDNIDDEIRKIRLGGTFDNTDSVGRTIVSLYLHQGLGTVIGGGTSSSSAYPSRTNGSNDFTKVSLSAVRVQSMVDRLYSIINFTGQYSFNQLLASEQVFLGGANSVRGQPYSSMYGDSGFVINAEMRYTLIKSNPVLQFAAFIDYGFVYSEDGYGDEGTSMDMAGAGLGIRAGLFDAFDLRLDVAFPVGDRYGEDYYLYGQLRYGF